MAAVQHTNSTDDPDAPQWTEADLHTDAAGGDDDGGDATIIASIQLTELEMLSNNPAYFTDEMQWRMRLELLEEMTDVVTVSFYWVGSVASADYDQLLDEFDIGPLSVGVNELVLEHGPPAINRIPADELFEVTGLYIVFAYRGQTFLRVGYYAKIAFWDDRHMLNPPAQLDLSLLGRNVLMQRPMVTTYPVDWDTLAQPIKDA
jgi:histone chaperone ASF1